MLSLIPTLFGFAGDPLTGIRYLVETATGWGGLLIIGVYSFLIAFVLPLPSEVVLAAPLQLGIPRSVELGLIVLVSASTKAAGSIFAFRVGHMAKEAGPVIAAIERLGFDMREWSKRQTVRITKRYGYAGLAFALSVPFFPDTLSIYAFSVLGEDYIPFAVATFVGSAGRLLVTLFVVRGAIVLW